MTLKYKKRIQDLLWEDIVSNRKSFNTNEIVVSFVVVKLMLSVNIIRLCIVKPKSTAL